VDVLWISGMLGFQFLYLSIPKFPEQSFFVLLPEFRKQILFLREISYILDYSNEILTSASVLPYIYCRSFYIYSSLCEERKASLCCQLSM